AAPIMWVAVGAREQLTGARRLDHGDGTVGPGLRLRGVEWNEQVQPLHVVGIERGEDRGLLGDVEIGLVEPDLRCVARIGFLEPVTLKRAPARVAERLVFPEARIAGPGQLRPADDDAVAVPAE